MANQVIDPSTQYAEGATAATATGNVILWKDAGNALTSVTASKPLPVSQTGTATISGTVTANAGTNLNTSALALETGGNLATIAGSITAAVSQSNIKQMNGVTVTMNNGVAGTGVQRVTIASDSTGQVTLAAGANTIGALTANQSVNCAQMNGVAVTMNNGVSGTGVQRVTLASDSTGQVTLATGANTIGALTANQSVNVAQINGVTPLMGNGVTGTGSHRVTIASDNTAFNVIDAGDIAHDGADSGKPVKIGFKSIQTLPAAVSDLDRTDGVADKFGRQITVLNAPRELVTDANITLTTTTETTLLTAVSSTFLDLTSVIACNTSNTSVRVDFRDTTAGSVRFSLYLAARGGAVLPCIVPVQQTSVNTNWTAQLSGAVTDVRIFAQAAKNK